MRRIAGADASIELVGRDQVRGVPTTRYRAKGDDGAVDRMLQSVPQSMRQGDGRVDFELWIDDENLPRRLRIVMTFRPDDGEPFSTYTTMEMFDFGADIDIEPPPDDQVTHLASREEYEALRQAPSS